MSAPQAPLIHEFGDFELDPLRRVLKTRPDGQPVDITGRVLDALIYFVERPGQLVDKRALLDALWPNVVVEEGNLSQTVHTLRRVLGEKAGEHRYIATVPGRGYQFVAAVTTKAAVASAVSPLPPVTAAPPVAPLRRSTDLAAAPAPRRQWLWPAVGLSLLILAAVTVLAWPRHALPVARATVPAHPTIAVLPFVDMSDAQDQLHFADGLSEEILNILAHADNLRVTARTSSFSFRGENVDIKTIAQRLDVAYVLEGSVRKAGDRLRITAQLIDASTSAHVWSDTYDRDVHDVFGVQREIATAVASALRVTLGHEGPRRAETSSTQAYEHYLQGRFLFNRRSPGDLLQAKAHFDEAVRIDPSYARAWAGLAGVLFVARYDNIALPDSMKNWGNAIQRAITLDPELAEGHMRAAQYYWLTGQQERANAELARAEVLDPQDPLVLSATMGDYIANGRIAEAVEIQKRIVAIDPLSAAHRGNLGSFLVAAGQFPEAQAELERALELSPASPGTITTIADVLLRQNRSREARDAISRMPDGYRRDARLAILHFELGETREADEILRQLEALARKPDFDPSVPLAISEVYATRNDKDRAFEWLARAKPVSDAQSKVKPCWALIDEIQVSAYLQGLRPDPRWDETLKPLKACLY